MLVINRVRVLGSGPHTPTQYFWQYPTPPPPLPLGLASPRTQMYFRAENTSVFTGYGLASYLAFLCPGQ